MFRRRFGFAEWELMRRDDLRGIEQDFYTHVQEVTRFNQVGGVIVQCLKKNISIL
jgi:hypothetical protein